MKSRCLWTFMGDRCMSSAAERAQVSCQHTSPQRQLIPIQCPLLWARLRPGTWVFCSRWCCAPSSQAGRAQPLWSSQGRISTATTGDLQTHDPAHGVTRLAAELAVGAVECHSLPLPNPPAQAVTVVHHPLDFLQHTDSAMFIRWDTGFLFEKFLMYSDYPRDDIPLEELGQRVQQSTLSLNILFCFN